MPLTPLALAAASSFSCLSPSHHDGDNVRCANIEQAIRLQGIDAPEMPGACRPGRDCTPGDPFAARDHLRSLTAGRELQCTQEDVDRYGRIIARCSVGGVDLSCAMIAAGHAVSRYATIECGGAGASPPLPAPVPTAEAAAPEADSEAVAVPIDHPQPPVTALPAWPWWVAGWLIVINLATYAAFAIDKARAERQRRRFHPERRIAETTLHGLAALGGSPAAWAAIHRLRHKSAKPSFKLPLLLISGLQLGAAAGGLWWWLGG